MRKNSFSCVITVLKFQLLLRELCHSEIAETDALSSFIGASFRLNALGAKIKSVELLQNTGNRRSGEIDPSRNRKVGKALSESGFEGGNLYFPYVRFNPSSISKDDVHEQTSSSSTRPKLPNPSKINAPISDSDRASLTDLLSNPQAFPLSLITRKNCQHPDHLVLTAAAGDRMGVSAADIEKKAYSLWRRVALYNAAIDPAGVDGAKCLLACGSEAPHCLAACHRERARRHGWARETPTLDEAACTRACGPFAPKCVSVCTTSRKLVHRDAPEPSVDEQDCDAECGPASSPACLQSCALERAAGRAWAAANHTAEDTFCARACGLFAARCIFACVLARSRIQPATVPMFPVATPTPGEFGTEPAVDADWLNASQAIEREDAPAAIIFNVRSPLPQVPPPLPPPPPPPPPPPNRCKGPCSDPDSCDDDECGGSSVWIGSGPSRNNAERTLPAAGTSAAIMYAVLPAVLLAVAIAAG